MNKLLSIGLVGLCALTLVGCGSNETDSSANTSRGDASEKVEKDRSNDELKSIFTALTDSFIGIQTAMGTADEEQINESIEKALVLSENVKSELKGKKTELEKELNKQASTLADFANDVTESNRRALTDNAKKKGEQIGLLSKNHFDSYMPESMTNLINQNNQNKQDKIENPTL